MSEDYRMSIFDAVAMVSTFFFHCKKTIRAKTKLNFYKILSVLGIGQR
jgi:hypothetical protein